MISRMCRKAQRRFCFSCHVASVTSDSLVAGKPVMRSPTVPRTPVVAAAESVTAASDSVAAALVSVAGTSAISMGARYLKGLCPNRRRRVVFLTRLSWKFRQGLLDERATVK